MKKELHIETRLSFSNKLKRIVSYKTDEVIHMLFTNFVHRHFAA